MAGMRDKVVHRYFRVDYDIIGDVALNKLPFLRRQIEEMLRRESRS